ncbi:maleylpyruvate isomerase family mycothiol-dependent enzyme [Actinoplanes sp. NEAU-A12]|uniref:Maleylpyruvate isomerase family mycothiol-dependent enzyme n=1 Tax=Actinoplanes sandaracinus TaxID=3045177 RepID=A0ABT6X141_9ACTN|nr:maleylpyruvate isomerase family mycothiol-dependent enzyme [Actinoplanes sandaracinus]MDI6105693.1 maleylpyruvate isomerase family mycothiol-dependent enzyme [Actinoplanes sandaracinus]
MTVDHLALLHDELTAFQTCLKGDLSAPVKHCGDWTLRDLAEHLGQGNLWAATAILEGHGNYQPVPPPEDFAAWFAGTARVLTASLDRDPATEAWTFAPPHTVGFWQRRRCLETVVHRWDAENALGRAVDLDAALCGDGVAEVIEVFVPRMVKRGLAEPPRAAVRFTATDLPGSWTLGPGDPVATLTGTAQELMLALWNRGPLPWDGATGDLTTAREALAGPLVP